MLYHAIVVRGGVKEYPERNVVETKKLGGPDMVVALEEYLSDEGTMPDLLCICRSAHVEMVKEVFIKKFGPF